MSEEIEWVPWVPKVGDIRPEVYRFWSSIYGDWYMGTEAGLALNDWDARNTRFQIPSTMQTEPRPPWIDPQCKFRWGDRVKDKLGNVWFVNNPWDMPESTSIYPVLCTVSVRTALPYSCYRELARNHEAVPSSDWDIFNEEDLELFPEDLPKHFDDRLLDADPSQEQPRVPREIWVNEYPHAWGNGFLSREEASQAAIPGELIRIVHFREVL